MSRLYHHMAYPVREGLCVLVLLHVDGYGIVTDLRVSAGLELGSSRVENSVLQYLCKSVTD